MNLPNQKRWITKFAVLPTFVGKRLIWLKDYYEYQSYEIDVSQSIEFWSGMFTWTTLKRTTSKTEYILFGEQNV